MKIPEGSKYERFCYVEVARFVPKLDRIIRIKASDGAPLFLKWGSEVEEWRIREGNMGLYTSVFHYNKPSIEAQRLGSVYFDLDSKEDPELALREARVLTEYLLKYVPEDGVQVYFTGEKGYHVEAEALALGVDPGNELAYTYRYISKALEEKLNLVTIDFQVYEPRRMWRLPASQHQRTGLYKTLLTFDELFNDSHDELRILAAKMQPYQVPDPQFSPQANEWLRNWVALKEEDERKQAEERIARFSQLGTAILPGKKKPSSYVRAVFRSTLEELKASGEGMRNHTLNKAAFCLYRYVFEGSLDEEYVTNTLREAALALGLDEPETEGTLNSALRAAENAVTIDR